MNKNFFKIIVSSSVALTLATPAMTLAQTSPIVMAAEQSKKTVGMTVYKYSKNHRSHAKSMAQGFVGNKVKLTIKQNHVTKMTIHVDGQNSPMGKGQNVNKIVKALKINGVKGKKTNISADNSSFDFVFSGKAFKNNGWVKMQVTIDFGGKMTEQAWVKYDKVSGLATSQKKTNKKQKKVSKKTNKKVSKKAHVISADKKIQTIDYAVYKADHSGISAANNFYTHCAKIEKVKHGYVMNLKVEVKHGMVTKFEPISIGIGIISNRHFTRQAGKDVWSYQVHFNSLDQLKKQVEGSLRLSVPIADIHNRLFKVWFAFGVKDVAHNAETSAIASTESADSVSSADVNNDQAVNANTNAENGENNSPSTQPAIKQSSANKSIQAPKSQTQPVSKVKPKKKTMATIAAVEYPFLPVIAGFAIFDAAIIGLAFYLRNRILKGKKKCKN